MKMRISYTFLFTILILGTLLIVPGCPPDPENEWGCFIGQVAPLWLDDGRTMRLTEDFTYVDPSGKNWVSPNNSEIDGASIPQAFWTLIGSPFSGKYRNASVVHDTACDTKVESWKSVHKMFYEACRCGGVDEWKAKVMYWAVYHFGPHWPDPGSTGALLRPVSQPLPVEKQLVALVREGIVSESQVYSVEKLRERSGLLSRIQEEDQRLDLTRAKLTNVQDMVNRSIDLQSTKAKYLEERIQARRAVQKSLDSLRQDSLSEREFFMKKEELQKQLQEAESQENIAQRESEALAKTLENHQKEMQTLNSELVNIKDTKQKLITQLRPEDELVDMAKVIDHVESYFQSRDLSLTEIESLDLETIYSDSIE